MQRPILLICFLLSISYVSFCPDMLSLSHAANPRAVIVKCDGCAYDVDVVCKGFLFIPLWIARRL